MSSPPDSSSSALDTVLVPIHRAGWPFIGAIVAAAILLGFLWAPLSWIGLAAAAWCTYFFRDPPRVTPLGEGLVVSPADGRVQMIAEAVPPEELELGQAALPRISIFLNIFDVHINRIPVDGRVVKLLKSIRDQAFPERHANLLRRLLNEWQTNDGKYGD
jgi:phosphatidylserine decarboxylase